MPWVLLAGCVEPPKTGQMEQSVMALADLYTWDPHTKAKGQASYDSVMGWGPEVLPHLVAHLTDMTPTAIYEPTFQIQVTIGDVCFLLLLDLTGRSWQEFHEDGIFVHRLVPNTQNPNPIFNIRWDMPARKRVQRRFARLLELEESK